jgi:hypothetical protein
MGIAPASHREWRMTRHKLVRSLRITVLALACAAAWFSVFAPERVEAMFRPPPRETPAGQLRQSLPMKYSIFPPRSARV